MILPPELWSCTDLVYAGIGSREARHYPELMDFLTEVASTLREMGFILSSGGAIGADTAFERGAGTYKRIWRPEHVTPEAYDLAEDFHPAWERLDATARGLHARNGHILLGEDLQTPVSFVLAWTPDGKMTGGTAQGLRLAQAKRIPVFNFGSGGTVDDLEKFISKFV